MSGPAQRAPGAAPSNGSVLVRVLLFSLALTLVANSLPQVEGEAPQETQVDLGALTMDSFVALGESLFKGKGTCTLCHNNLGRAPDLLAMNVVATADERVRDERYGGAARDVLGYLRESLLEPGAFVVKGYGKKGSDDTESPMPAIDKAPIQLSAVCHSMLGTQSPVGPALDDVGMRLGAEEIRQSIIGPDEVISEGFFPGVMPGDFADRMTIRELEMMVRYLAEQKG